MKHLMILCLLLAAQVIRADDNPPAPLPEPSDTWESFQISNGALTWESKSEVAPGRTLYTNVWFVDYYKEAFRIGIEDVDPVVVLRHEMWCRGNMHLKACQKDSPNYWLNDYQNSDEKFCKSLGKSSSLDFKITDIKKIYVATSGNYYHSAIFSNEDLQVHTALFSNHGLLSVICAD